ncbi:hypothetical protein MASR2M15_13780 [Anaerolineales bacterium]
MSIHIHTPLIESLPLSALNDGQVYLKMEAMQACASFKARGIGHTCTEKMKAGAKRFVCASGGNAGLAVAYSGRKLGIPSCVVVPKSTGVHARELIEAEGAEVIVHGESLQEAHNYALSLVDEDSAYIHPYDDPLVWEGHATLVDELVEANYKPDMIVLSVGGGGLMVGVIQGLRKYGWQDIPILAVETIGADSLYQSIQAGERITLSKINSSANTLGAKQICERAFNDYFEHPVESIRVTDREALEACEHFVDDHRVLVELACGAALAPVYAGHPSLENKQNVLVIVCGGAGITLEQLAEYDHTLD